jgi:fructosamine-3-kinase
MTTPRRVGSAHHSRRKVCHWLVLPCLALFMSACADRPPTTQPESEPLATKGRAQLWAENCIRCHNARSPAYYGDREWDVAMQHMHVRGYLTAKETRAITQFIQSAND